MLAIRINTGYQDTEADDAKSEEKARKRLQRMRSGTTTVTQVLLGADTGSAESARALNITAART